jgi:nucleoside-diphosphate-sugar epimerase
MPPSTLLIGSGYTLSKCADLLPTQSAILLRRSPQGGTSSHHRIEGDVATPHFLTSLLTEYSSVTTVVDSIPPLRTGDPLHLVTTICNAVASAPHITTLFYLSTTGVYGVQDGSWVDETTRCAPQSAAAQARLDSEERYRTLEHEGKKVVMLRIPAIVGPGRGSEESLKNGTYPFIENGEQWTNRIHVDVLARGLVRLLSTSLDKLPRIVNCIATSPTRQREYVGALCQKHGYPLPQSLTREEAHARGMHTVLSNQRVMTLYPQYFAD